MEDQYSDSENLEDYDEEEYEEDEEQEEWDQDDWMQTEILDKRVDRVSWTGKKLLDAKFYRIIIKENETIRVLGFMEQRPRVC
jgi:hypothetical protein